MRIASIEYELGGIQESWEDIQNDNAEWSVAALAAKTGIEVRHVATSEQTALTLAVAACSRLLDRVGRSSIDGLVYVTQSPDTKIPANACILHEKLLLPKQCLAFDVNQGCSGFVYGVTIVTSLMAYTGMSCALVVCSDTYRRYVSRSDRACRPIFSDGASATLLVKDGPGSIGPFEFMTDGSGAPNLTLRHSLNPGFTEELYMDGPRVLMFTMAAVPKATASLLERAGLQMEDIDLFVDHQASAVVLDSIQRRLKIPDEKFLRCLEDFGNTVSSTIPIALKYAIDSGRLKDGMTVLLMGFGVGYSVAGCIVRT